MKRKEKREKKEYISQLFADFTLGVKITGESKDLERAAKDGKESLEDLADTGKKGAEDLEKALAAAGILVALEKINSAFKDCALAAEKFETAQAQLATIAGVENIGAMSKDILELSDACGVAATELSGTAYAAVSAGSTVESAVGDARIATQLATAGFTDTTSALKILKTATNSYGDAQTDLVHISDSLIQTQNLGVTTIQELAQNMGISIATASAYGVSLENLEAAYISTTKSGINTANSTTYLSAMINELGDSGSAVAKIIQKKTGKSFGDLMKDGNSLADVLEIVLDSVDGNTEAMMQLWGQATAGKAASAIVNQGLQKFRSNLDKVTKSAGSTAKAYGIMEDTTAHAHEKMENSIQNLTATIGAQLNPMLKGMYDATAKVTQGLADFVAEHPAVVSMAAAVTTGLGIMVGGLSVYTLGIKAATAVTGLFTASLAVNPIFLFATAIGAATAAIGILVASTNEATKTAVEGISPVTQKVKELTEDIERANGKVKDSLNNMDSGFRDNAASIEGSSAQAKKLADRLQTLARKTDRTSAEEAEMNQILETLESNFPGINKELKLHGIELENSAEAIGKYVDRAKQMSMAQAYYDAASEAYKSVAEAEMAAADAQSELDKLVAEGNSLKSEQLRLLNMDINAKTTLNGVEMSVFEATNLVTRAINENSAAQTAANAALTEANALKTEASAKADEMMAKNAELLASQQESTAAQAAGNAEQRASIEVAGEAVTAWQGLSAQQQATAADFANAVSGLIGTTQEAIASQMSIFDEFNGGVEVSTDTLLANMESQITGVREWEANMAELADRGINADMLQKLAEMGPQGSGYVQAFVSMSDEELAKANSLWSESVDVQAMTDDWGQRLIESGTENISRSMGGLNDLMESSGADTALGLARGIESVAAQVADTGDQLGIDVIDSVNNALGVSSPSWKMEESGRYIDEGLERGIYDGLSWVTAAARAVAQAAVDAANAELGIHSPSKVARKGIGNMFGEGLVLGILDFASDVKTAVEDMISPLTDTIDAGTLEARVSTEPATVSSIYSGVTGAGASSQTGAYAAGGSGPSVGGIYMTVNGAQGQDVDALAEIVTDRIVRQIELYA